MVWILFGLLKRDALKIVLEFIPLEKLVKNLLENLLFNW